MRKIVLAFGVCLALISSAYAQHTVTGTVVSGSDGQPIPGLTVVEKGVNNGTITDADGNYSITVQSGDATLVFSFVSMETQEIPVNGRSAINVTMKSKDVAVDEVVVTALGISRAKKSLGYSVTEVAGDEVSTVKDANPINSLSGRVAGVTITQGSFGPGSSSRVIIRGNNSITGNNQPLYVVDGVPVDNSGFGSANEQGVGEYSKSDYGTGIGDINPDDVASITVLKGPNAAALYGSRAANGVIMITTKKGSARKGIGVSVTSNTTFDNPMLLPKYQNQYGQGSQGAIPADLTALKGDGGSWGPKMDGSSQLYYTGENRPYSPQPDNVKNFFRTGVSSINTLALDGGNDKINMRFSYTNSQLNSIIPNSRIERNNFNLRAFAKLTDKLTVDAKATYFKQYGKNRPSLGTEGIMSTLINIPRNIVINDLKTYQDPLTLSSIGPTSLNSNPYWTVYHDQNKDWKDRFQGFAKIQYDFTDWLSAYVRVGTDMTTMNIEQVYQYGQWYNADGAFSYRENQIQETNADFLFMVKKDLTDKINLNATLGGNALHSVNRGHSLSGAHFRIPSGPPSLSANTITPGFTPMKEKRINSLYGTVSLSYDRWFYLDGSARNDWSSTLPETNWSYFYPSVSASILFNDLLKLDNSAMTYSKLRVSWAQVGNDTDPYLLYDTYSLAQVSDSYLGETTMSRSSTKYNPNLKPEQITSTEVGGEFRFFDNRLHLDMSYYNIKSKNLIMPVPISASTGYSTLLENVGEIENKGFEAMLGATPVRTQDLTWDVSVNFATNKNTLNSLIPGTDTWPLSTINSGNVLVQATVGGGFGDIYGTTWNKTTDGKIIVNADGVPTPSSEKVYLGNYQPDWTGGMTNTLTYKNFRLSALVDARFGGKVYSGTDVAMDNAGTSKRSLQYRDGGIVVDGVLESGETNTKQVTAQQYWDAVSKISSEYVYDQTNVRLRELSLIWDLPKAWLSKTVVKSASLGFVGRNLFFIYKKVDNFDPESSYSVSSFSQGIVYYPLPTTRSLGFNLNVKF